MEKKEIRVTVWNEFIHEKQVPEIAEIYPDGIHGYIAGFLEKAGMKTRLASLEMPEHGLTEEVLSSTDVLVWWGHMAHEKVGDEVVQRVYEHVQNGMGLILLHSSHASKIFSKLCGTTTLNLKWRESGDKEILWVVEPGHPIVQGLGESIILEHEETYGERFDIPKPDDLVFISLVFRRRGFPQRLLLQPRARAYLLFSAGPRNLPHLPQSGHSKGHLQCGPLGGARGRPGPQAGYVRVHSVSAAACPSHFRQ